MYKFSNTSLARLNTCHPKLQEILNEAINHIDFTVMQGHRTKEEQNKLYPKFTKLEYPKSKHNRYPSHAVDICPFIPPYGAITGHPTQIQDMMVLTKKRKAEVEVFIVKAYARLMGNIERIAFEKDIKIRLGMDWNMNFDMLDQNFHDLPHIELV
jgi:hypothetical protein